MKPSILLLLSTAILASSKLIVDFKGGEDPITELGNAELEGQELGCKIVNGKAGDIAFIKNGVDKATGKKALHLHRDPHIRRAEMKAMAKGDQKAKEGKTYYIGYNFRIDKAKPGLDIFQWKKWDKKANPAQNIPLYVFFNSKLDLVIEYTIPGGSGSNREIVWTGAFPVGPKNPHSLGFVINTDNSGKGWAKFYLDGVEQKFNEKWGGKTKLEKVYLFTGDTSPKFGIYRGEASGGGKKFCPSGGALSGEPAKEGTDRIFDSYIYRIQISDSSLDEVAEAAGLKK